MDTVPNSYSTVINRHVHVLLLSLQCVFMTHDRATIGRVAS